LREPVLDLVVMGCTAGIATDEEDGSGSGKGGANAVTGDKVVGFECERSGESAFSVGMDKVRVGEAQDMLEVCLLEVCMRKIYLERNQTCYCL
jgi:hypothetical protein